MIDEFNSDSKSVGVNATCGSAIGMSIKGKSGKIGDGMSDIEQLKQLINVKFIGDCISKHSLKRLKEKDLACGYEGYNVITKKGLTYLYDLGLLN